MLCCYFSYVLAISDPDVGYAHKPYSREALASGHDHLYPFEEENWEGRRGTLEHFLGAKGGGEFLSAFWWFREGNARSGAIEGRYRKFYLRKGKYPKTFLTLASAVADLLFHVLMGGALKNTGSWVCHFGMTLIRHPGGSKRHNLLRCTMIVRSPREAGRGLCWWGQKCALIILVFSPWSSVFRTNSSMAVYWNELDSLASLREKELKNAKNVQWWVELSRSRPRRSHYLLETDRKAGQCMVLRECDSRTFSNCFLLCASFAKACWKRISRLFTNTTRIHQIFSLTHLRRSRIRVSYCATSSSSRRACFHESFVLECSDNAPWSRQKTLLRCIHLITG